MLGEELKRRREDLGVSLSQISEKTRIGTRFLRAIESNDFAILPEGIYRRSFIRAYARHVGMDEDEAVDLFQQQTGQDGSLTDEIVEEEQPFVYRDPPTGFWPAAAAAAAVALILIMGALGLWHYVQRSDEDVADDTAAPSQQATTPVTVPQNEPKATPASFSDGLKVTLEATNECWIGYTADDGQRVQEIMQTGETKQISANESIDLSIGNTHAITIRINGRDARLPEGTPIVLNKLTITPETAADMVDGQTQ